MNLAIFDIDGTLTATTGVDDECFIAAVREVMGFTIVDADWGNYVQSTDHGLAIETSRRYAGREPTAAEVAAVKSRFVAELERRIGMEPGRCRAVPGVREFMGHLRTGDRGRAWRIGVASGAWPESAAVKLRAAGIDIGGLEATFSHAHADGRAATREEIGGATIRKLGGGEAEGRVVYVGDGVWDARAARNLEIGFVGVRHDGREEGLRREGVRRIVRDYTDREGVALLLREAVGE